MIKPHVENACAVSNEDVRRSSQYRQFAPLFFNASPRKQNQRKNCEHDRLFFRLAERGSNALPELNPGHRTITYTPASWFHGLSYHVGGYLLDDDKIMCDKRMFRIRENVRPNR